MTYQVFAGRGTRSNWEGSFRKEAPTYTSAGPGATDDCWYGWLASSAQPASPAANRFGPVPRLEYHDRRLHPSSQLIGSDLFWNPPAVTYQHNYFYSETSNNQIVRNNHAQGANSLFLDGHVRWSNKDSFDRYVRYFTGNAGTVWWASK